MKKMVTTRQLLFILAVSILTLKVLLLPNVFASNLGRDGYLMLLFIFLCDFLVLLMFLFLMNKYKDMTFEELLQYIFGKTISKIIMFLLFLYFVMQGWNRFQTNYVYLDDNLYTTLSWYTFAFPIVIVSLFCLKQGLNAYGRLCEFFMPIVLFGFIVTIIVGVFRADYTNALPFLENGVGFVKNAYKYSAWFGDYMFLIIFFGKVKCDKKFNLKVLIFVAIMFLLVVLFHALFYFTYGNNTICHTNAISDIMQFLPSVSDIGSFDWILILVWDIALFLDLTLNVISGMYCFGAVFTKKCSAIIAGIIYCGIIILNYLMSFNVYLTIFYAQTYLLPFIIFVQGGIPFVVFIFGLIKRRKQNEISLAE